MFNWVKRYFSLSVEADNNVNRTSWFSQYFYASLMLYTIAVKNLPEFGLNDCRTKYNVRYATVQFTSNYNILPRCATC